VLAVTSLPFPFNRPTFKPNAYGAFLERVI